MILTIRSWFDEPEIEFKISHKVHKFIRQNIIDDIIRPFALEDKEPNLYIGLVITTNTTIESIEVRGPEYDKKNKFINYGLWLPYERISKAENYLNEYLQCLFDALVTLFNNYFVPESIVRGVQNKVKKEVLSNEEYEYTE